jgi:hypothetical protein
LGTQLRNRQQGYKTRNSLSSFLEEGEVSDEERSVDELAADGDVGLIKEQFGMRTARSRRKKRLQSDRDEADNEQRLERAKHSSSQSQRDDGGGDQFVGGTDAVSAAASTGGSRGASTAGDTNKRAHVMPLIADDDE